MKQQCATCAYAEPAVLADDETLVMECHRYPPVIVGTSTLFQARPQVEGQEWCGEWKPKDPIQPVTGAQRGSLTT